MGTEGGSEEGGIWLYTADIILVVHKENNTTL